MADFFFDSVSGSDSNSGASWAAAFKGDVNKQIMTYLTAGNRVYLKGNFTNQILGSITGQNGVEIRVHEDGAVLDCRTRHSSGWTNVLGSRVWKKSYSYQVHRVLLGNGSVHGFVEGADVAKKVVVNGTPNAAVAATDAQVVAVLDTGTVDQSRFWYWDGVSDTLYVRSTNSSTNPDTAYGGVWTVDGSDSWFADRRRWEPLRFTNCSSLYVGPVQLLGATKPMILDNCNGTIEPYLTHFPHYQWPALALIGSTSGGGQSITVDEPRILCARPYFDEIHQVSPSYDDGNGFRNQGGMDMVTIEQRWASWSMYGGTLEGYVHGGLSSQWYHGAIITSGLVRGVYFDGGNMKYSRSLNLQMSGGGAIGSFVIERCTFNKQSVVSQVHWDNLTIRDCVWRLGANGWAGNGNSGDSSAANVRDKYHPTHNWYYRWRNSGALGLGFVDGTGASTMTIENNIFYGQRDEPINMDDSGFKPNMVVRNNVFIKVPAVQGPYGDAIFRSYNGGSVNMSGNRQSGYGSVPGGVSSMTSGEVSTATARALAHSIVYTPASVVPGVGGTAVSVAKIVDEAGAGISGFNGLSAVMDTPTLASVGAQGHPVRILCIGDSLTAGDTTYTTFRGTLRDLAAGTGVVVDFIGPKADGQPGLPDPQHAGYGGFKAHQLTAIIDSTILTSGIQPDVIVLFVGWNNVYNGPSGGGPTSEQEVQTLYETIRDRRPNAKIIFCTLHPEQNKTESQTGTDNVRYNPINTRIRSLAASNWRSTVLAELAQIGYVSTDYFDSIHMKQAGSDKFARAIFDAMSLAGCFVNGTTNSQGNMTLQVSGLLAGQTNYKLSGIYGSLNGTLPITISGSGGTTNPPPSGNSMSTASAPLINAAMAAANSAPNGSKNGAFGDSIIAGLGSNPRRRILWGGVEIFNSQVASPLTRNGQQVTVPGVTANALASANIASGSGVHRLEKANDSLVYIETPIGNASSNAKGRLSANPVAGQPLVCAPAIFTTPSLDAVSNQVDRMLDHMRANIVTLNAAADRDTMKGGAIISGGDFRPVAIPSWWGGNRFTNQAYWTHMLPWYVVWDITGHQANLNVRVQIRNLELWILDDDNPTQWRRISIEGAPAGDAYDRDVVTPGAPGAGARYEPDGSYSIRVEPFGQIFHGYGGGTTNFNPAKIIGVHTRMQARKMLDNPSGADQRNLARYALQVGLDHRPYDGVTWSELGFPNGGGYIPGQCSSRWNEVGNDWEWFFNSNVATARSIDTSAPYNFRQYMSEAAFRAAPPPSP